MTYIKSEKFGYSFHKSGKQYGASVGLPPEFHNLSTTQIRQLRKHGVTLATQNNYI